MRRLRGGLGVRVVLLNEFSYEVIGAVGNVELGGLRMDCHTGRLIELRCDGVARVIRNDLDHARSVQFCNVQEVVVCDGETDGSRKICDWAW